MYAIAVIFVQKLRVRSAEVIGAVLEPVLLISIVILSLEPHHIMITLSTLILLEYADQG